MTYRSPFSFLVSLAIPLTLALTGCCTQEGCDSSVTVAFDPVLPAGEYRLEVEGAPTSIDCTFEIDSEGHATRAPSCEDMGTFGLDARGFEIFEQPTTLNVAVSSTDPLIEVQAVEQYELTYKTTYPNGKSCGPECISAAEQTLDVSELAAAVEEQGLGGAGGAN